MIGKVQNKSFLNRIRQEMEKLPLPETEESILLRVLVQVLVIVGIIATDIAAETFMSVWAIPLSIVGGIWSWRRRKKRNVVFKFLLAISLLVVLFAFFGNLFATLNDTRVVLAQLLIQVQVLHSFDLPRRKDLGYSMAIGLILLGVAGTVSQTLAFAPWLFLFLVIAIPTLVLDYRSRLGLETMNGIWSNHKRNNNKSNFNKFTYSPLSPSRIGLLVLIVVSLGLLIFAIAPRFQGYQIQTFPVSGPPELQNQGFDSQNRGIINPGYVRGGEDGSGGSGIGEDGSGESGELDDTYYYGFNSKINQNLTGQLKPKVVLRVRSQAPGFWRVLGFDRYTGEGWEISRDDKLIDIKRHPWSYRFPLSVPYNQAGTKKVIQTYSAVSDLPNLVPVLSSPKYVYFPSQEIAFDPEGGLRAPFGLIEGMTYTVISEVPYRDRTLLGQASEVYPDNITKYYLQIPPEIENQVREKTEELLEKADRPLVSAYEKSLWLAQSLKQTYSLKELLPTSEESDDLVTNFLFSYEGGYPDHFSTVLTIMLRSIGIPARLAVGFAPGQFNPFTGYYVVKNTDAYALTEVYFPDYGWHSFDPIPGHPLIPPSFEDDQTFGILKEFWKWIASWLPSPVANFISEFFNLIFSKVFGFIGWLWGFISGSLVGIFVGLILLIVLGFLSWLGFKGILSWLDHRHLAKLPPMHRLYLEMLGFLKEKGYPKHPSQTPLEYANQSYQLHQKFVAEIIQEISKGYVSWRYGNQQQNVDYLHQQFQLLTRGFKKA